MARVTLREVARAAGVSAGTASEALRGVGRIPADTRARIRAEAARLGYRPDPLLASLAARHFRPREDSALPIAILVPQQEQFPDIRARYRDMATRAASLGYEPRLVAVDPHTSASTLTRTLFARGVEGIILALGRFRHHCPALDWSRFAVVSDGPPPDGIDCHSTSGDHLNGLVLLARRLAALGFRRIGLAPQRHPELHPDDLARHAGALLARHALGDRIVPPLLDASLEDSRPLLDWVRAERPDVVAAFHAGQWWSLREAFGERFAKAFALIVRTVPVPVPGQPSFAGLLDSGPDCSVAAVDLLDQAIRLRERGITHDPRTHLVRLRWVDGDSLHPAPRGAVRRAQPAARRRPSP